MSDRPQRVLYVHAHPDDGSVIRILTAAGADVTVLACTGDVDVAASHTPGDSGADEYGQHHLSLGRAPARWSGLPDRRYAPTVLSREWGETEFAGALLGEVAADVAAAILEKQPDAVLSYAENGGDGHPDHVRAHEAALTAAEAVNVAFYAIDSAGSARGSVRVGSGSATVSFTRVRTTATGFMDGPRLSRFGAVALAAIVGAAVGILLTFVHQSSVTASFGSLGPVPIPWGILVSLALTTSLLAGLRLVFETRIVAGFAAAGLIAAVALLGLQPAGGSVLIPADPAGYTWTFGPIIIAALVLAWPAANRREIGPRRDIIDSYARNGPSVVKGPPHP